MKTSPIVEFLALELLRDSTVKKTGFNSLETVTDGTYATQWNQEFDSVNFETDSVSLSCTYNESVPWLINSKTLSGIHSTEDLFNAKDDTEEKKFKAALLEEINAKAIGKVDPKLRKTITAKIVKATPFFVCAQESQKPELCSVSMSIVISACDKICGHYTYMKPRPDYGFAGALLFNFGLLRDDFEDLWSSLQEIKPEKLFLSAWVRAFVQPTSHPGEREPFLILLKNGEASDWCFMKDFTFSAPYSTPKSKLSDPILDGE